MNGASAEDVRKRINDRFDKLYVQGDNACTSSRPYVCVVCDEIVAHKRLHYLSTALLQQKRDLLQPDTWNKVAGPLADCYKFSGDSPYFDGIEKLMLSPRASYIRHADRRSQDGFSCCGSCKKSLQLGNIPRFAIVNNYYFGLPPPCLLELNDIEIAMLTPVKTYGYCFSFTGGVQKQLKGSLSYYKVNTTSIARAAMHFDVLGLNNNVVVMLYGQMTASQIARAQRKSKIRTQYILTALQWLITNNEERMVSNINLQQIVSNLKNPVIIDNSLEVEGTNVENNIEDTESFQVFFQTERCHHLLVDKKMLKGSTSL